MVGVRRPSSPPFLTGAHPPLMIRGRLLISAFTSSPLGPLQNQQPGTTQEQHAPMEGVPPWLMPTGLQRDNKKNTNASYNTAGECGCMWRCRVCLQWTHMTQQAKVQA